MEVCLSMDALSSLPSRLKSESQRHFFWAQCTTLSLTLLLGFGWLTSPLPGAEQADWQYETANFVVQNAPSPELAQKFCETAEKCRREMALLWLGRTIPNWSEKCAVRVRMGQMGAGGATTFVFQNGGYEDLNNVLYQTSRRRLLECAMTASGTDHANALQDALAAFACNDFEIIEHFFPKHLPLSKGIYYTENIVNLLHIIYYGENESRDEVLKKVEKFLSKKLTNWEKYFVLYFMALLDRDAEQASECLQELCVAYQKQGYPVDALDKCFAAELHGLYRFARLIDEDFFNSITRPKHDCFFEEFEIWQQENNYPKGKLFYTYPPEMDYVNKLFAAELPTVALREEKYGTKTEVYKDKEKFAKDLTENIKRIM